MRLTRDRTFKTEVFLYYKHLIQINSIALSKKCIYIFCFGFLYKFFSKSPNYIYPMVVGVCSQTMTSLEVNGEKLGHEWHQYPIPHQQRLAFHFSFLTLSVNTTIPNLATNSYKRKQPGERKLNIPADAAECEVCRPLKAVWIINRASEWSIVPEWVFHFTPILLSTSMQH